MLIVLLILAAVFLDYLLGEPERLHPLAGFGRLAVWVEGRLYGTRRLSAPVLRLAGAIAWLILIIPFVFAGWWLGSQGMVGQALAVVLLYLALGANSLFQHARTVAHGLQQQHLSYARERVGMMVSRDTAQMNQTEVVRATIESVLENGCDAIFGALFWFLLLGAPGVVLYRLANTLDAMWGYRNERYADFGWAAARSDDLLNWIPARLTALGYIVVGKTAQGWRCWQQQGRRWYGVNPGVVMASGAGALNLVLGGPARYHGMLKERPILGAGKAPDVNDIERSVLFVQHSLWLWLGVMFIGGWCAETWW
ncbi:MAG: adenosylcobinamide-phosphate synthase CbiB [Gammaproteobacteria bacterium]|nr:adenosylcobinamide-phosphate synthase CbiB [Gammaproteobacteria bacterium]MDH5651470.1 adenosylcobinamide-phosphate synthase CbiB [Gammaproteobacteria bacterium]